jgi:hypothetical protein
MGGSRPVPPRMAPPVDVTRPPPPRRRKASRPGAVIFGMVLGTLLTLGAGLALLVIGAPPRSPESRVARSAADPTTPGEASATPASAGDAAALRALVAAEEARLEALTETRERLSAEIDALVQRQAELRRDTSAAELPRVAVAPPPAAEPPRVTVAPPPPAAALTAPPPPRRPAEPVARVYVHHRSGSGVAEQAAVGLTQLLGRDSGFEVAEVRSAGYVPSTRVVRYFHDEDAAAAARLAGRLGSGWAIQDFRAYTPQPAPRTLEVWLPDR